MFGRNTTLRLALIILACATTTLAKRREKTKNVNSLLSTEQKLLVDKWKVKLQDLKLSIEPIYEEFDSLHMEYKKDFDDVVEYSAVTTEDLFTHWAKEEETLQEICAEESKTTCEEETVQLIAKKHSGISDTAQVLSEKKMAIVEEYRHKFSALQVKMESKVSAVKLDVQLFHDIIINASVADEELLGLVSSNLLQDAEAVLSKTQTALSTILEVLESFNGIVFGNVCFEYQGVKRELLPAEIEPFNEAMKVALDFAFTEERMDYDVVAYMFIAQVLIDDDDDDDTVIHRKLRRGTPYPVKEGAERNLSRRYSSLRVASATGVTCRDENDQLNSDVVYRTRGLYGNRIRELFNSEFMETMRKVLKVELKEIFGNLDSIKSFHCSDFQFISQLTNSPESSSDIEKKTENTEVLRQRKKTRKRENNGR